MTLAAHPLADRFPMLPDEELDLLTEDIRENGLRQPVTVSSDGLILDGRNRYAACQRLGIEPETVTFDGTPAEQAALILSANVSRRHQPTGSRAMSTALVLADVGKREGGRWKRGSVGIHESVNSRAWNNLMAQAGLILDHAPDLAGQVVSGILALDAAYKQAEQVRDAERLQLEEQERIAAEEADARAQLEQSAPEYLDRYETARQALAAWEDHHRAEAARLRRERAAREAEEKAARQAHTHTYTRLAEALQTVSSYGHVTAEKLMADFRPDYLNPPQLARALDPEALRAAARTAINLVEWQESRND